MKKRSLLVLFVLLVASLALAASGCGGGDDEGDGGATAEGVTALPASGCTGVEYKGEGEPQLLIASDLPMQGSSRFQTVQMVQAIRHILDQRKWKAGDYNIAYQVCDDATSQAGKWDSGKCNQNAQAYAENADLVGVVGTFNSGCAAIEIPVMNQAPDGGVALVSPANTFPCLTVGAGCDKSEPDKYYPTGKRNYARVVPYDAYQAAVLADLMKEHGIKKLFVLNDKEAYGLAVATLTRAAAEEVGIDVVGFAAWAKESASYEATMRQVKASGADALFLGGLIDENGGQVIKDKVAVLGPNDGAVKLYMPDGFTTQATIDEAGVENAKGSFLTVAGGDVSKLTGEGKEFLDGFKQELGGKPVDPYGVYAAQAAVVLLDAIGRSDGTRAGVIDEIFKTKLTDSILGSFEINENGDVGGAEGVILKYTVYKAGAKLEAVKEVEPRQELADAASAAG